MSFDIYDHHERTLTDLPQLGPAEIHRFRDDYIKRNRPVVLRDYHTADKAYATWSFAALIERLPDQSVDIDIGDIMLNNGLFASSSLHDFLRLLADGHTQPDGQAHYLQGFNIFALDPTLLDEISFPHLHDASVRQVPAGWLGPAGTVTGYHSDISHNQLSQVVGRKLVKLVSPDQSDRLYPHRKYDNNGIACAVDADTWDAQAHPRFADTDAFYTVVNPGDSVFIPAGWFHYVRSLDASISVNYLGYTLSQLVIGKTQDQYRRFLHNRGMYGDSCTCHMVVDGQRVARR